MNLPFAVPSLMFRRPTTMKQKLGVQMNISNSGKPSKSRWCIYFLLYTFVFICVVTGIADLYLLMKSIVRRVSNSDPTTATGTDNINSFANDIAANNAAPAAQQQEQRDPNDRCAINFFGLPRAFESLVLPSIVKNIITPNPGCDYYVHYYHMTEELEGRSGGGGTIDPTAILLLRDAVHKAALEHGDDTLPIVEFVFDKEEDFWKKYTSLIEKIRTTKVDGKYLYFPWKATTYRHPVTTDNIVKMWHSIQSSYQLMEDVAATKRIEYKIVAMLRSDVVYVTPINIHDAPKPKKSDELVPVTIPNFGKHPVSDRIIYGPREAVKAWATQRFARLESHVEYILKNDPGWGMHSERFVNYALFPLIQNITKIRQHPTLCFFRARADESVWVSDCSGATRSIAAPSIMERLLDGGGRTLRSVVQDAIGRPCSGTKPTRLTKTRRTGNCEEFECVPVAVDNIDALHDDSFFFQSSNIEAAMKIRANFHVFSSTNFDATQYISSPAYGVNRFMLDRIGNELARATTIVQYQPNSKFPKHTHIGGEEFIVLEGTFHDQSGSFPAGSYVRNPIGTEHEPWVEDDGCTIMVKLLQMADLTPKESISPLHIQLDQAENAIGHLFDYGTVAQLYTNDATGEDVEMVWIKPEALLSADLKCIGGEELFVMSGSIEFDGTTYQK